MLWPGKFWLYDKPHTTYVLPLKAMVADIWIAVCMFKLVCSPSISFGQLRGRVDKWRPCNDSSSLPILVHTLRSVQWICGCRSRRHRHLFTVVSEISLRHCARLSHDASGYVLAWSQSVFQWVAILLILLQPITVILVTNFFLVWVCDLPIKPVELRRMFGNGPDLKIHVCLRNKLFLHRRHSELALLEFSRLPKATLFCRGSERLELCVLLTAIVSFFMLLDQRLSHRIFIKIEGFPSYEGPKWIVFHWL